MIRAKFQVTAITEFAWSTSEREITFEPRYDPSIPEDKCFSSTALSGKLRLIVTTPAALNQFQMGRFFYLDFTPVEEA